MTSPRATPRSLGSVKVGKGSILPPLERTVGESHKIYFQEHHLMITGDAVHTSVRGGGGEREEQSPRGSASRPLTARVDHAGSKIAEELKELQTKERHQKNKIASLHKSIEQMKLEVREREEECGSILAKFEAMEEHYRKLYEEEKAMHGRTQEHLDSAQEQLAEKIILVEELTLRHDKKVTEITDLYENRLHNLQDEKDKAVGERDERIAKLKKQMADLLKSNSWERQQQLEELSKELTKVSEETNMLRMRLKSHKNKKDCDKCVRLQSELEQKNKKISEKDELIQQLKALCSKFETQLTQQDILLKEFAESKGHKVDYNPKK